MNSLYLLIMKDLIVYLNIIRFWPHLLIAICCPNSEIIKQDIDGYAKAYKIQGSIFYKLLYFLFYNKSYRSLFYFSIGKIKWLISWLAKGIETLTIPKTVKIGKGLLLFHSYGTILNARSIGEDCRIVHNVTLGDKNGFTPKIGDRVEILPNAVIVGDITIGNDCVIGPGAVVYKSIPANCVVVGNPAFILKKDGKIINQPL